MTKYVAEYSSNNSGGSWWLSDDDWKELEKGGWVVDWVADQEDTGSCRSDSDGRWLGALACSAYLVVEARTESGAESKAIAAFEDATIQSLTDEGCSCCGPPHSMYLTGYDNFKTEEYNQRISAKL